MAWDSLIERIMDDCPDAAAARRRWEISDLLIAMLQSRHVYAPLLPRDRLVQLLAGHGYDGFPQQRRVAEWELRARTLLDANEPCQCEGPPDSGCPSCEAWAAINKTEESQT